MYILPQMLKLTKQVWPSKAHKTVAENILLCNSRYTNLTDLKEGASIIAAIPKDKIKLVTAMDLYALGIMLD